MIDKFDCKYVGSHYHLSQHKEPIELLLRVFLQGGQIEHDGFTWAMSEDGDVCWVSGGDAEQIGHGTEMTVKGLKTMADNIGRDELWLLCCAKNLRRNC